MGNKVSSWNPLAIKKPRKRHNVIINGTDAAGKTTLVYKLGCRDHQTTIPTIGFLVETCHFDAFLATTWATGGNDTIRPLWRNYYNDTDALVWVVDSTDHDRLESTLDELLRALHHLKAKIPLLLLCNKQDLPHAYKPETIVKQLCGIDSKNKMPTITDRPFLALGCSATQGLNIRQGFDWLGKVLAERQQQERQEHASTLTKAVDPTPTVVADGDN